MQKKVVQGIAAVSVCNAARDHGIGHCSYKDGSQDPEGLQQVLWSGLWLRLFNTVVLH